MEKSFAMHIADSVLMGNGECRSIRKKNQTIETDKTATTITTKKKKPQQTTDEKSPNDQSSNERILTLEDTYLRRMCNWKLLLPGVGFALVQALGEQES